MAYILIKLNGSEHSVNWLDVDEKVNALNIASDRANTISELIDECDGYGYQTTVEYDYDQLDWHYDEYTSFVDSYLGVPELTASELYDLAS